jgi:hypothetical protein
MAQQTHKRIFPTTPPPPEKCHPHPHIPISHSRLFCDLHPPPYPQAPHRLQIEAAGLTGWFYFGNVGLFA